MNTTVVAATKAKAAPKKAAAADDDESRSAAWCVPQLPDVPLAASRPAAWPGAPLRWLAPLAPRGEAALGAAAFGGVARCADWQQPPVGWAEYHTAAPPSLLACAACQPGARR